MNDLSGAQKSLPGIWDWLKILTLSKKWKNIVESIVNK